MPLRLPLRRRLAFLVPMLLVVGFVTGCASDARSSTEDARETLAAAKRHLDSASTVRFTLTGSNLPDSGAVLVGGRGVVKRPASFSGEFRLATGGAAMTLKVISISGTMYAQLPFTHRYTSTSAKDLGVPDPAQLLDPKRGLSSFLTGATNVRSVGRSREGREVVAEVSARLPASAIRRLLVVSDSSASFQTRFFVVEGSNELRKATFRGPFYGKNRTTTYTVELNRYGEPATITPPRSTS